MVLGQGALHRREGQSAKDTAWFPQGGWTVSRGWGGVPSMAQILQYLLINLVLGA